jgi:hypothetical protein
MRRIARVLALSCAAACAADGHLTTPDSSSTNRPPPAGIFTTNSTEYTARIVDSIYSHPVYAVTVVTRYRNTTGATIYLERCYPTSPTPMFGVILVAPTDSWGSAYNQAWACVGHDQQLPIQPGATRVDTLQLLGPTMFSGYTNAPFGLSEGTMRLSFMPLSCAGNARCLLTVDSLRYSNEFVVHVAK